MTIPPLPKSIKLGRGYTVRVVLATPGEIAKALESDLGVSAGYWDADIGAIIIDKTIARDRQWNVYWHELIHAVNDIAALNRGGM